MKDKVIFATGNEGKMKEIRMLLGDVDVEVLSLKDAGISLDVEERCFVRGECADQSKGLCLSYRDAGTGR